MKILLISNQSGTVRVIGNPILSRMLTSLRKDPRVEQADFAPFRKRHRLQSLRDMRRAARHCDIVHVHFGGMYAILVWLALCGLKCRKFITFHGTDIHAKSIKMTTSPLSRLRIRLNQWASFLCILLYEQIGFVAQEMTDYLPGTLRKKLAGRHFIQGLGVDYTLFHPTPQADAKAQLGLGEGIQVLFSDVHNNRLKRRDIAERIVEQLGNDYHMLVMYQVQADEVPVYINACDFLLLTSDEEGSPNIIREALALDKRVYSVEVGDAVKQLQGLSNSQIISRDPQQAARQILQSLQQPYTDHSRETIRGRLDFDIINKGIVDLYVRMLSL